MALKSNCRVNSRNILCDYQSDSWMPEMRQFLCPLLELLLIRAYPASNYQIHHCTNLFGWSAAAVAPREGAAQQRAAMNWRGTVLFTAEKVQCKSFLFS